MAAITATDNADGTVTFTVTGATGTVTIKTTRWSGGLVNATWATSATRSGNGTVNATLAAGMYWAYAENAGTASTMIGFRATDGEDSPATLIRDAVQARLQAMSLDGIASSSIYSPRKLPIREQADTFPGIILTIAGENDRADIAQGTNERDNVDYTIQAQIIVKTDRDNTNRTQIAQHDRWRWQIAKAFNNQRLPAAEAYRCEVERRTIYEANNWAAGYESHSILMHFIRRETRGIF